MKMKPSQITFMVTKLYTKGHLKKYVTEGTVSLFQSYKEYSESCKKEIRLAIIQNEWRVAKKRKLHLKKLLFKYITSEV